MPRPKRPRRTHRPRTSTRPKAGRSKSARGREHRGAAVAEWIGGCVEPASLLGEPSGGAQLLLWVEQPEGLIIAFELLGGEGPTTSLAELLARAVERPLEGAPRHPPRVRVATEALARELRAAFVDLEVRVAPTPELDTLAELLFEGVGAAAPTSYLTGDHDAASVGAFFSAAEALWSVAPWQCIDDDLLLRVDVPALAVEGAALSVIGSQGAVLGFVLFPSHAVHDAFFAAAKAPGSDVKLSALSLTFASGAELPAAMTREVAHHGWPVANAQAYPVCDHRDPLGAFLPLGPPELRLLTVVAGGLTALCREHAATLGSVQLRTGSQPLSVSYRALGHEVAVSAPHGASPSEASDEDH